MSKAPSEPMTPDQLISELGLRPHPEGGHFCETFRDDPFKGQERAPSTAIYYLLKAGEHMTLGPNISAGERPQGIVRKDEWQAAEPLGDWTLVGCTVAPGFDFAGFELAPKSWQPGKTTK